MAVAGIVINTAIDDPLGHAGYAGVMDRGAERGAYLASLATRCALDSVAGRPLADVDVAYYVSRLSGCISAIDAPAGPPKLGA
jgi:hypothetical protein